MNEQQGHCETAQELWDFLAEYVWPVGGSLLGVVLRMSETGHAFWEYTYWVPEGGDKAGTC